MAGALTYEEAARLLGREDPRVLRTLDAVSRGLLLGAAVVNPVAVLGWLDARQEFVRLSRGLVAGAARRARGRLDRTERLTAAHTVVVVAAFFEELAAMQLPLRFADLELTRSEQLHLAGGPPGAGDESFIAAVREVSTVVPQLRGSQDQVIARIRVYYQRLVICLADFVRGLSVVEAMSDGGQEDLLRAIERSVEGACGRYLRMIRELATEFPEVAFWIQLEEHQATREEVRALQPSLLRLEHLLAGLGANRASPDRRNDLATVYKGLLTMPVISSGDVPSGLHVPALSEAYIPPLFRLAEALAGASVSDEQRWTDMPVCEDLAGYLAGYLTSPLATTVPILVLGQPGAGKSVLARVLAARLPADDFMPVLVKLRDVPATADLQGQIESAVYSATGVTAEWPRLSSSAGGALPVVILDGFDELLQATGVRQTDYLDRVATFQRREAELGRPVAIIVTTRTSVADRARTPPGTLLLRLEPFDSARIVAWTQVWNEANRESFAKLGVAPLDPAAVLQHPQLAGQPLLLLMLALYDADGNPLSRRLAWPSNEDRGTEAIQRSDLGGLELYERLLAGFARREVWKRRPDLVSNDPQCCPELELEVEKELRALSCVAFAMFNRAAQWVTGEQLDKDLVSLGIMSEEHGGDSHFRAPLKPSDQAVGRFFFIHRARATRDDTTLHTFEFLHATFGEYLVARYAWQVLRGLVAGDIAGRWSGSYADDDRLYTMLSFSALTVSVPAVHFLIAMAAGLGAQERQDQMASIIIRFRAVEEHPRVSRQFSGYEPRHLPFTSRAAIYSANLLVLGVITMGSLNFSELVSPGDNLAHQWHCLALLWHARLPGESWEGLVQTLGVERLGDEESGRDIRIFLDDGALPPSVNPTWWRSTVWSDTTAEGFMAGHRPTTTMRRANFQCGTNDDVIMHAIEPLFRSAFGPTFGVFLSYSSSARSAARALIDAWQIPFQGATAQQRVEMYERCFAFLKSDYPRWPVETRRAYGGALQRLLASETCDDVAVTRLTEELRELLD